MYISHHFAIVSVMKYMYCENVSTVPTGKIPINYLNSKPTYFPVDIRIPRHSACLRAVYENAKAVVYSIQVEVYSYTSPARLNWCNTCSLLAILLPKLALKFH